MVAVGLDDATHIHAAAHTRTGNTNTPSMDGTMLTPPVARWRLPVIAIVTILTTCPAVQGQGIMVPGVGTVNRSMASVGTATPIEAIGALHWNPATISALPSSEVSFGLELLLADVDLTTPGGTVSGEAGVAPLPAVGWVHHLEDTNMTIGLGLYAVAGFRNNLPPSAATAALGIPNGGRVFYDAEFMQLAPTISWALTDRLSFGFAPTITTGKLTFDPLPNGNPGSGNRLHWGGGFQAGLYYIGSNCWNFGLSYKSTQWFETFRFFDAGSPGGVFNFGLDLPAILSFGTSYTGFENWVLAMDVRYFDYKNTDGFDTLGWNSTVSASFAAQYKFSDSVYLRLGYQINEVAIKGAAVTTNVFAPLIQDHHITMGASYRFAENVDLNMAYMHMVGTSETDPATGITMATSVHSAAMGVTVRY